mgnify:FL=1
MNEIKWRALFFGVILAIAYLLILNIFNFNIAILSLVFTLTLVIIFHTYWLYQLDLWLDNPTIKNLPNGSGIWNKIFSKIYRTETKQKKTKQELFEVLDLFKSGAGAMLDGVVAVNKNNEILWSNKTAQRMLNIIPKNDYNRPIFYIYRNTYFKAYIENENYEDTLKINNQTSMPPLEIKVAYFGSKQRIIVFRDITKETEIQNMRKEFVSNFSHEIKTPLTVLIGFIETLAEMKSSKSVSEKKIISMMSGQANRMNILIEDLLLLSHIESNQHVNRSEKINIAKLIRDIKKNVIEVKGNGHKFDFSIDSKLDLYGARQEIESAFNNLITNAIRYTPSEGQISIRWNLINTLPIFEVVDNGIGIPEKNIKRISERFYRVDPNRSRETGGTGLGLAIVKNVVNQHQGEMKINSDIGLGSSFKLIFPADRAIK